MNELRNYENFVLQVAERYRADGYVVLAQPSSSRRPRFLREFAPDFIVRRGNEKADVGIKRIGQAKGRVSLRRLAEAVESKPGWRFDIVIFSPEEKPDVKTQSVHAIRKSIEQARTLFGRGDKVAAFLLAWSGFEAAGRRAVEAVEEEPFEGGTPFDLSKTLLSHGLISESQWKGVNELLHLRNAVAHGALDRSIQKRAFEKLCNLAERLIDTRSLASTTV